MAPYMRKSPGGTVTRYKNKKRCLSSALLLAHLAGEGQVEVCFVHLAGVGQVEVCSSGWCRAGR